MIKLYHKVKIKLHFLSAQDSKKGVLFLDFKIYITKNGPFLKNMSYLKIYIFSTSNR